MLALIYAKMGGKVGDFARKFAAHNLVAIACEQDIGMGGRRLIDGNLPPHQGRGILGQVIENFRLHIGTRRETAALVHVGMPRQFPGFLIAERLLRALGSAPFPGKKFHGQGTPAEEGEFGIGAMVKFPLPLFFAAYIA
jgi:hypothetical protein